MNPDLDRLQAVPVRTAAPAVRRHPAARGSCAISIFPSASRSTRPRSSLSMPTRRHCPVSRAIPLPPPVCRSLRQKRSRTWATRRYQLKALDPATQVLPVTRHARGAVRIRADGHRPHARCARGRTESVLSDLRRRGAAGGGEARLSCRRPATTVSAWLRGVDAAEWRDVQLVYVCSPGNPTGHVMSLDEWKQLFELSDRHGFVIASDECYSEIYFEEGKPPLGSLQAAHRLGRDTFDRLVMFCSLSKRSSVPGMRSGFVAGDASAATKIPAVSHVSRHRDERRGTASRASRRGKTKRTSSKTAAFTRRNSRMPRRSSPPGFRRSIAGCGVLSVGTHTRSTIPNTHSALCTAECHGAAGQLISSRDTSEANPGRGYVGLRWSRSPAEVAQRRRADRSHLDSSRSPRAHR